MIAGEGPGDAAARGDVPGVIRGEGTIAGEEPGDAAARGGGPRLALLGFVAALLAVHGIAGWLSPLAGEDWDYLLGGHRGAAGSPLGDLVGWLLVRSALAHPLGGAVAAVAVILGGFALGARRLPDPRRGSDALGVALVSCILWIALPRAGAMWFHRSDAAAQIWGAAIAAWFLVPYRCRSPLTGRGWPAAMALAGLVAGAATRQVALAAVVGAAIWTARTPRREWRAWMAAGLAGAAAGLIAGFARSPWIELGRVFGRLEPTLVAMAPVLRAGGPVIAATALLALAVRLRRPAGLGDAHGRRGPGGSRGPLAGESSGSVAAGASSGSAASEPGFDAGDALGWLVAWLGLGVAAQLGPRASEATLLPAAVALAAGALPALTWLAGARWIRRALVAAVIGAHAAVWILALSAVGAHGGELRERMAVIAATPAGRVATVRPYAELQPGYWSPGEDWAELALRTRLARAWGLAGIELAPGFRGLERGAELDLALEVDGASAEEVVAAAPPARWPGELAPARRAFVELVERLRKATRRPVVARLRVRGLEDAALRGRPVLAAWADAGAVVAPEVRRAALDGYGRAVISIAPELAARLDDAWQIDPGGAAPVRCPAGRCAVQVQWTEVTALVLCDATRCLIAEAWRPRF